MMAPRGGPCRYAAPDLSAIEHDEAQTLDGEFIRGRNPGSTRSDDHDIAFLATPKRCRVWGNRNVHPKRFAAPIGEMIQSGDPIQSTTTVTPIGAGRLLLEGQARGEERPTPGMVVPARCTDQDP